MFSFNQNRPPRAERPENFDESIFKNRALARDVLEIDRSLLIKIALPCGAS